MSVDRDKPLRRRAAVHAALSDPARLAIVDALSLGDASPSEIAALMDMPSNLLAHHVNVLEGEGLVSRRRSEGDRRRTYLRLVSGAFDGLLPGPARTAQRVLFVCTANSARSVLAASLWRRASEVPSASAGTHPAQHTAPGALAAAARHRVPVRRTRPRHVDEVGMDGDLIVTVCDRAHEELGTRADLHWSVPDPVPAGSDAAFDEAFDELSRRVADLAPRLTTRPSLS
jgi:ArsR family transcriptional regulator, arsenate/arsenite/antimonite-responsive transcriptional repressor / arsenate reductase (thioredoxin)